MASSHRNAIVWWRKDLQKLAWKRAPKKVGVLYYIAALSENENRNYSKDLKDYLIITSPHQRMTEAELDVRD